MIFNHKFLLIIIITLFFLNMADYDFILILIYAIISFTLISFATIFFIFIQAFISFSYYFYYFNYFYYPIFFYLIFSSNYYIIFLIALDNYQIHLLLANQILILSIPYFINAKITILCMDLYTLLVYALLPLTSF